MKKSSLLKLNKIWKKLALGAILTVLFIMLIMNVIIQRINSYYHNAEFETDLESMIDVAASSLEEPLWNLNEQTLISICDSFFKNDAVSQIVVKDVSLGILFDRKTYGFQHESDLLTKKTKEIEHNGQVIGSVELTMTRYFIEQQITRSYQIHLLEMVLLIAFLIMTLFVTITKVTKPLTSLKSALESVAESEDDVPQMDIRSDDEIGDLSRSFNIMSYKIIDARRAIQSLNEDLEHKVEERTEELNLKNAELIESLEVIRATEEELLASNKNLSNTLTELQEVQELLVESGKMALLGELVAGVAHEINTPIGVSLTVSSFIEREVNRLTDKVNENTLSKKEFLESLGRLEESSASIVRNLLRAGELITSFKQVAVDQASHSIRIFNFHDYLNETIRNLHSKFKHRKIDIVNECPEDITVVSYPGAYAQIFTNLIMNSLLHGFDEDDSGIIRVNVEKHDDDLIIRFHDNGRGIEEAYIKKIFNPFFTTKRGEGGTGLGLNITYNIAINILKGNIVCQSKLGVGTTFILTVPFHHPDIDESLYH
ncbi:sensor histidine kinase [Acidaminobacter sp. JC074]|uniref:sensor histidine kinase n=1 Tax=Acidaminobacter sp. JC074 TaxID=2530199 RepID=UPI001F109A54|nr:ATP-binding protein [Acidaminobacter sp. JC074]